MKFAFVAGLCALSSALAATPQQQLIQLASAGDGIIRLNSDTFDLLTSPRRTWSATIQLTALDKRRRCNPCRLVFHHIHSAVFYSAINREFDPSWNAVGKAWTYTSPDTRNQHFFATLDFDEGTSVFQRVRPRSS